MYSVCAFSRYISECATHSCKMLQIDCTSTYKSVYKTVGILNQDLPQEIRVRHNENRRSSEINPAEELKIIVE